MNGLSEILARAAERQNMVHSDRDAARRALLVFERDDQQLQKIIKHGRAYHEALEGASPEVLAAIGAGEAQPAASSRAVDDEPCPQVDQSERAADDETAEDSAVRPYPVAGACAGVDEVQADQEAVDGPSDAEREPDRKKALTFDQVSMSVLAYVEGEASNGYAAVKFETAATACGVSLTKLSKTLTRLADEKIIQKCKSKFPEPGWATYRVFKRDEVAA